MFRQTLAIRADFVDALNNLGSALGTLGRQEDAETAFRQVIAAHPNDAVAYNNLGHSLWTQGKYDEALTACTPHPLSESQPRRRSQQSRQHSKGSGKHTRGPGQLSQSRRFAPRQRRIPKHVYRHCELWGHGPSAVRPKKCAVGTSCIRLRSTRNSAPMRMIAIPHAACASAMSSSDFLPTPVSSSWNRFLAISITPNMRFFVTPMLTNRMTPRKVFKPTPILWRFTHGWHDDDLAEQIRKDGIDILVDLKLHTLGNRLLAFAQKTRPRAGQLAGIPRNVGLDTIDWRLTDRFLEPPDGPPTVAAPGNELAMPLPDCFWCYDPMTKEPIVGPLPAKNAAFITFGSLNTFGKINDETLDIWAAALAAVPSSRFIMLAPPGSGSAAASPIGSPKKGSKHGAGRIHGPPAPRENISARSTESMSPSTPIRAAGIPQLSIPYGWGFPS